MIISESDISNIWERISRLEYELSNIEESKREDEFDVMLPDEDSPVLEVFDPSEFAFGCTYDQDANTVSIEEGYFNIGQSSYILVTDTVTLTAATEFVYVNFTRSTGAITFDHSVTRPSSDASSIKISLTSWLKSGGVYSLIKIHHIGDINYDTPMR